MWRTKLQTSLRTTQHNAQKRTNLLAVAIIAIIWILQLLWKGLARAFKRLAIGVYKCFKWLQLNVCLQRGKAPLTRQSPKHRI